MWTPPADLAPGRVVRGLIRRAALAGLGTAMRADGPGRAGAPYVSLVELACDMRAVPILLISSLADHTKNLAQDATASLLLDGTAGLAEPLTGARATLQGRLVPGAAPADRERYLARHPGAALYAGFKDFRFHRFEVERAHLVAGFGRIHWLEAEAIAAGLPDDVAALGAAEAAVVAHMNADHSDAVGLYANRLLGLAGVGWRLTGVDPDGADLARWPARARIDFDKPAADAEGARVELVRLVKRARRGG